MALTITLVAVSIYVLFALIGAFFTQANEKARQRHATFKKEGVIGALENVLGLSECRYHDEWDLFLAWPIDDPHLESIRQKCLDIRQRYPSGPEGDIGSKVGQAEVKRMLDDLRGI